MTDDHAIMLGEIKGKLELVLDKQDRLEDKIDCVDGRLRKVETKAAVNGAVCGGIVSVGVSLMIAKGKSMIGIL